jgi:hypothetical protein
MATHERLILTLRYEAIEKRSFHGSMEMSFFISCPITRGLSVPRTSGHTRNAEVTMIRHGGRCPDVSGPASALRRGHEIKKDISILFSMFSFSGDLNDNKAPG